MSHRSVGACSVFDTDAEIDELLIVRLPALGNGFGLESDLPAQLRAQHDKKMRHTR